MEKIYYRKLVRDRIPKRISESGGRYHAMELSDEDFAQELMSKIEEEAGGLSKAKLRSEIVSEMGDLLDVLKEVRKLFNITPKELSESRKIEFKRKGGFKKRTYLVWAEDTGYKTNERMGKK